MNVSTREQWIEFAGGLDEAAKYECLFVAEGDPSTLPAAVRAAREQPGAEPGAEYWSYLAEQWLDHMWPPSPRPLDFTPPPPLRLVKPRGLLARLGIMLLRRRHDA